MEPDTDLLITFCGDFWKVMIDGKLFGYYSTFVMAARCALNELGVKL